jgi:hypothetical protein
LLHLFHDLQIHRTVIGLGNDDVTVHINMLSIHS